MAHNEAISQSVTTRERNTSVLWYQFPAACIKFGLIRSRQCSNWQFPRVVTLIYSTVPWTRWGFILNWCCVQVSAVLPCTVSYCKRCFSLSTQEKIAALLVGRSRDRFPVVPLDFSVTFPSDRTMTLGSNQPLVKMSNRNISGDKGGRCVRLTTSPPSRPECHWNLGT
jgi:hypothetical protein